MAGLALRVGGFGGVGSTSTPQWGTTQSYDTVTAQAFGPGATVSGPSGSSALAPNNGFGWPCGSASPLSVPWSSSVTHFPVKGETMLRHPATWFVLGVASVYAYHHWVKPFPGQRRRELTVAGLGIGIAWAGYALLYYGVTQVQGGNWGLLDLCIPSRWAAASGNPKDDGTKSAQTPATAATSAATAAAPVVGTVNKLPAASTSSVA